MYVLVLTSQFHCFFRRKAMIVGCFFDLENQRFLRGKNPTKFFHRLRDTLVELGDDIEVTIACDTYQENRGFLNQLGEIIEVSKSLSTLSTVIGFIFITH